MYVLGRNTDLSIISRLGPALFSGNIKKIDASISRNSQNVEINAEYPDGKTMFPQLQLIRQNHNKTLGCLNLPNHLSLLSRMEYQATLLQLVRKSIRELILRQTLMYMSRSMPKSPLIILMRNGVMSKLVFDSAYRAGGKLYKLRHVGSVSA